MVADSPAGWTGKILRVDLTTGEVSHVDTLRYVPAFIGGLGVAARIAWEELARGTGPFDPANLLFIMVGPLTGTLASGAGRVEILGIAPQQHPPIFTRSGMGGHWGAELKYAGYDGVILQGRANRPVYLWIDDDRVELRDAAGLWGRGTYATTRLLRERHGSQTRVISCGQAGERLSRIAVIQTETGNAAGQGGFGGVMGSKNLKAIAVRGTRGVKVARPRALLDLCMHASREGAEPGAPYGGYRFRQGMADRARQGGMTYRWRKCGFCATPCAYPVMENVRSSDGISVPSVARHCWGYAGTSSSVNAVARAVTSDYGLNGWEIAFGMIPWLQICKQHGLIDDVDGVPIPVPDRPIVYLRDAAPYDAEFVHTLVRTITFREGPLGDALAEGTCYAAEQLFDGAGLPFLDRIYPRRGGQTEHWAGHWGPGGTLRWPWWLPPLLQWCVDTRDPASDSTHQWTNHVVAYLSERGPFSREKVRTVCQKVYGNPDVGDPAVGYDPPEAEALPAIWHSHRAMIVDSLVLCDYEHTRVFSTLTEDGVADTALMSKLLSACTGLDIDEAELDRAGARIWTQLRALDVRNFGRTRALDESTLDSFADPGRDDGVSLDRARFRTLLDAYYRLSGWDPDTGCPTRSRLASLGLADVADALDA